MDYRSDVLPPALGIAISLAVHGWFLCGNVQRWFSSESPEVDMVVVDLLPTETKEGVPDTDADETRRKARSPEKRKAKVPPKAAPRPPDAPKKHPRAPSPHAAKPPHPEEIPAPVRLAAPPAEQSAKAESTTSRPRTPAIEELMPKTVDLTRVLEAEGPPDPTAEGVREATLTLGQADTRYRGYLDGVEAAINLSWQWREALLAWGRAGTVLLRFTLSPDGKVNEIRVEQGSGGRILDDEAIRAVQKASFPYFPSDWRIERLHLYAQFDYRFE